jgi:hypothetical protein
VFWRCVCPRDLIVVRRLGGCHILPVLPSTPPHPLCDSSKIPIQKIFERYLLFLSKCRTMITVYSLWRGHWVAWLSLGDIIMISRYPEVSWHYSNDIIPGIHPRRADQYQRLTKPATPHPPASALVQSTLSKKRHTSSAKHDWLSQMIGARPTN